MSPSIAVSAPTCRDNSTWRLTSCASGKISSPSIRILSPCARRIAAFLARAAPPCSFSRMTTGRPFDRCFNVARVSSDEPSSLKINSYLYFLTLSTSRHASSNLIRSEARLYVGITTLTSITDPIHLERAVTQVQQSVRLRYARKEHKPFAS